MSAEQTEKPSVPLFAMGCVLFFATGLAGLLHKVVWERTFALQMGHTIYAEVTLLSVFLGGLALGAHLGGRFTLTGRNLLVVIAMLELVVGVYGLLLPALQRAVDPVFSSIYQSLHTSAPALCMAQFVFVALLLIVPTVMMGAVLPILTRLLLPKTAVFGRSVGVLLGLGVAGGACGIMLAGFVLLPKFGILTTGRTAVATNAVAALLAFGASFLLGTKRKPKGGGVRSLVRSIRERPQAEVASQAVFDPAVLLIGIGVCGFAAMVCQAAWIRAATLAVGSSAYTGAILLAVPVLGIGIGGALLGWIGDRSRGRFALGIVATAAGLAAILNMRELGTFSVRIARLLSGDGSLASIEWATCLDVSFMVFVPTLCIGGLLPLAARLGLRTQNDAGRVIGNTFAATAIGAVLGAYVATFWLIPSFGVRSTLVVGAMIFCAVGALFLERACRGNKSARVGTVLGVVLVAAVAAVYAPEWDPSLLSSGPFDGVTRSVARDSDSDDDIRERMQRDVVSFDEGVSALVTVTREGDGRLNLLVDGRLEAASYRSIQDWAGHLPMILRPEAESVLMIGLGGGHSLSCVECYSGVTTIDVVERSAGVGRAARGLFHLFTADALDDPRLNLIIGDGRLHLSHADQAYDVIISRPSGSHLGGASPLLTRESFSAMKNRLNDGGVACLRLSATEATLEGFLAICHTWAQEWDHVSLWSGQDEGDYLLVGALSPLRVDYNALRLALANPCVAGQLRRIGVPTPAHFMSYLLAIDDVLLDLVGNAEINTDNDLRAEFDTLRAKRRNKAAALDDFGSLYTRLHDRRVVPWTFVTTRDRDAVEFLRDAERSASMLADQYEMVRSEELPPSERPKILEGILERNASDARAARALEKMRR